MLGYLPAVAWVHTKWMEPWEPPQTVSKLNEIAKVSRSLVYPVWVKAEPERNRPVGTVLPAFLKEQS